MRHDRELTPGEKQLIMEALLNEASRCELQQVNIEILTLVEGQDDRKMDDASLRRLREVALAHENRKSALRLLADCVGRGYLILETPIIMRELA